MYHFILISYERLIKNRQLFFLWLQLRRHGDVYQFERQYNVIKEWSLTKTAGLEKGKQGQQPYRHCWPWPSALSTCFQPNYYAASFFTMPEAVSVFSAFISFQQAMRISVYCGTGYSKSQRSSTHLAGLVLVNIILTKN